jgi:hypothetical protein
MMISLRALATISATLVWVETCSADCSSLRALAQQHANDMARRNSLDQLKGARDHGSHRLHPSLSLSPLPHSTLPSTVVVSQWC